MIGQAQHKPAIVPCVVADRGVTLVGAAPARLEHIRMCARLAPTVVAADGGVHQAKRAKCNVQTVIGDMDSIGTPLDKDSGIQYHFVAEQNSTDFSKCLRCIQAQFVLCVGFDGGRIDHTLAVYNGILQCVHMPVLVLGQSRDVLCVCPPCVHVHSIPIGTRVSLFPMARVHAEAEGLKWPLGQAAFAPNQRIGVSNESVASTVVVRVDAPHMLLIMPQNALLPLLNAVVAAPRWGRGQNGL